MNFPCLLLDLGAFGQLVSHESVRGSPPKASSGEVPANRPAATCLEYNERCTSGSVSGLGLPGRPRCSNRVRTNPQPCLDLSNPAIDLLIRAALGKRPSLHLQTYQACFQLGLLHYFGIPGLDIHLQSLHIVEERS